MNGIDNGQTFDPAFDAFFQASCSSSPHHQLQHLVSDLPSMAHHPDAHVADSSLSAYGHDATPMRPTSSSSGSNLHLNISALSVKGETDQQHQQRFGNSLNFAATNTPSPQSNLASPADAAASFSMHGAQSASPLLHPDGTSAAIPDEHLGAPTASSPLRTEHNLSNETGGMTTAMRSYSSTSIKSATGSQNADSPTSAFGGVGNQSMGDVSVDDPNVTSQSEADLAAEKRQSSKFVYKLFRMVGDPDYQHLISWNPNGTSVMVCNFDDFAKEVLGKHFKHSNFSSFIRQLNMYGFYKINKTPRGHRQSVNPQIWEFSHPKFLRGRPDLLDDIRRKALDSEHARIEARDLQYSVSVGQMQLRQQLDEMQFRLEELAEQNMALRTFTTQLRDVLGLVFEHVKKTSGGNLGFDVRIPTLDLPLPMPPQGLWTPQGHDGPPIFVTEPEFGAGVGPGGLRIGPGHDLGHGPQSMHGPPPSFGAAPDGFGMVAMPLSRRVSSSSAHSENMLTMNGSPMHGSMQGEAMMMGQPHGLPQRSPSFGQGQMPSPQFNIGRGATGGRPGLASLAIDTLAASAGMFAPGGMYHRASPSSAGLSASNAGLGVLSMPPSPLTPQHQAMMAAFNTPLPPSPAPGSMAGSPFIVNNGFPAFNNGHLNMADQSFFGPEDEGPNAKAMRTPLKRTASNSGPSVHGTPVLMQTATSPGLAKRKSPV